MKTLLCFGTGYCARRFAQALRGPDWRLVGTVRAAEGAHDLEREGFRAVPFDGVEALDNLSALVPQQTSILISIPPGEEGDRVARLHGVQLAELAPRIDWVGYLSTTGVYGDRDGGWVDEQSECAPSTRRGTWRVKAEAQWRTLQVEHGMPVHYFRLAGIYGPGRNALLQVEGGRARRIVKPGQVFGRIHADDIVTTLRASLQRSDPGAVYNVCDDLPAPPQDVIAYAAGLLGQAVPPDIAFEDAELTDMARSFYAENKRVRNERIKRDLGVDLAYPDYRSGLDALFAGKTW